MAPHDEYFIVDNSRASLIHREGTSGLFAIVKLSHKNVESKTQISHRRGGTRRSQARRVGARRGGADTALRGGTGAGRSGAPRARPFVFYPQNGTQPSSKCRRKHERIKSYLNRIKEHDDQLTSGLSAGRWPPLVPGSWPMDRSLRVSVNFVHAGHVWECSGCFVYWLCVYIWVYSRKPLW